MDLKPVGMESQQYFNSFLWATKCIYCMFLWLFLSVTFFNEILTSLKFYLFFSALYLMIFTVFSQSLVPFWSLFNVPIFCYHKWEGFIFLWKLMYLLLQLSWGFILLLWTIASYHLCELVIFQCLQFSSLAIG